MSLKQKLKSISPIHKTPEIHMNEVIRRQKFIEKNNLKIEK